MTFHCKCLSLNIQKIQGIYPLNDITSFSESCYLLLSWHKFVLQEISVKFVKSGKSEHWRQFKKVGRDEENLARFNFILFLLCMSRSKFRYFRNVFSSFVSQCGCPTRGKEVKGKWDKQATQHSRTIIRSLFLFPGSKKVSSFWMNKQCLIMMWCSRIFL